MKQVVAMFEEMGKDTDFNKEIGELFEKGSLEDFLSAAGKRGFDITEADWNEYRESSSKNIAQKISEEELKDVAGGNEIGDDETGGETLEESNRSTICFGDLNKSKEEFRDGAFRNQCQNWICTRAKYGKGWLLCRCHGTDTCINYWHTSSGHAKW